MSKTKPDPRFSQDTIEIVVLVHSFFNDIVKTTLWLNTKNRNLGGASPAQLFAVGREKKVLQFIKNQIEGNMP